MSKANHLKSIAPDSVILREGESSDGVYILKKGRVSVSRVNADGQEVVLAELGKGEVFGEMSLISHLPCSATVKAIGEVQALHLSKKQFVHAVADNVASVENVLRALYRRMRNMNLRVMELECQLATQCVKLENTTQALTTAKPGTVTVAGMTEQAKHALGDLQCFAIEKFPFRVGRWSTAQEKVSWFFGRKENDLDIHDIAPYGVSRHHCRLEKKGSGIFLIDTSHLGTWVDDERLCKKSGFDKILLGPGSHKICLGSRDSVFTFELTVH
jgi:CRP-like cAMP-binding protein